MDNKQREAMMGEQVRVRFDEDAISVIHKDGTRESVKWSELTAVVIETTDQGPFMEDVFFILVGSDHSPGCVVPQGAAGESELFSALQTRLPGFDNERVIEAMSSTDNNSFLIWRRT